MGMTIANKVIEMKSDHNGRYVIDSIASYPNLACPKINSGNKPKSRFKSSPTVDPVSINQARRHNLVDYKLAYFLQGFLMGTDYINQIAVSLKELI